MAHDDAPRPDLGDPAILQDPHPTYRAAFATGPVIPSDDPSSRTWFVGGHAEATALLRDPRMSADRIAYIGHRLPPAQRQAIAPLLGSLQHWQLFKDPPEHGPIRRSVNAALSRRLVQQREPAIAALVEQLLDPLVPRGGFDMITELAYPLPAIVIAELLGADPADRDVLEAWSEDIARLLGTVPTVAVVQQAQRSVLAMTDYFRSVLRRHRAEPREGLLGALLAVQDGPTALDDEALLANCVSLVFAGHETTTNLIGNAVHLLLDRPAVLERLRRDPAGWDRAIEEVLRFESPVQRLARVTMAQLEIGGVTIPAGDRIIVVLAAANRDPAVFDSPDTFDIDRHPNPHLGFGFGVHLCSGAGLARLEARIALEAVVRRLPGLRRAAPARFAPNFGLRSLETLPVAFDPGG